MRRKGSLLLIACVALISVIIIGSCTKQEYAPTNVNFTIDLSSPTYGALNNPSIGYIVQDSVIVIRTGSSTYVALSMLCTYKTCDVTYAANIQELICPCCGAAYGLNGGVISGPPQAPLTSYVTALSGHLLTVHS